MMTLHPGLLVLATEAGITDWRAYAALPLGVLFFLGSGYWLMRSNLGTKRSYLVTANLFFGFMTLISLFWAFGAPGTPPATGPTNLPGQPADEYQPTWTAFAETSRIAETPEYSFVQDEANFGPVPEDFEDELDAAITAIADLFSSEAGGQRVGETWAPVTEEIGYAESPETGYPVIRVTFQETYQLTPEGEIPEDAGPGFTSEEQVGEIDPEGETFTAFAYFDAGNPVFPSLVFFGISLVLWLVHIAWLGADEKAERRDRATLAEEETRNVPAGV